MKAFDKLPTNFQTPEVKQYYDILQNKKVSLYLKRFFDIILSLILIVILLIPLVIISICVKSTSKGKIFYKQVRVTKYGKRFKILKFRTMIDGADQKGSLVTTNDDDRVTEIGKTLRKYRLDELPQLFNVLFGSMSFVGTRPEVPKYVNKYDYEYYATLLLPAGVTSLASIMFKDEEKLLDGQQDIDYVYINSILPEKMKYNLEYTKNYGCLTDIKLMFKTIKEVF